MKSSTSFAFRAVHRNGSVESGVVEASSPEEAIRLIASRGAFAVDVKARAGGAVRRTSMSADDVAAGLRALTTLLRSGIPIARALTLLDHLVPPAWLPALPPLRERVGQGGDLAAALEESPLPLPTYVIGVIRAGESGAGLAGAVARCADMLEARAATRTAIRNALAYPLLLAVTGSASLALLLGVVLPRFVDLLADAGQTVPLFSRLVLGLGTVVQSAFVPALLGSAVGVLLWRAWIARPDGLLRWHQLLLSTPLVGALRRSAASATACSALAALLETGVPLTRAIRIVPAATGDRALEARLLAAGRRIETGERVSAALEAENALSAPMVRLARIGEESGRLADMFAHAAHLEAAQVSQRLQRAIRIIEPAMILLFGALVMLVAAGLLQAMYGLRPTL